MKTMQLIEVEYIGATDFEGSMIKLIDRQFNVSLTFGYDYAIGNVLTQAQKELEADGYTCHTCGGYKDGYIISVDHNGKFKELGV